MYLIQDKFKENPEAVIQTMWDKKRLEKQLEEQLNDLRYGTTKDDRGISYYDDVYYSLVFKPTFESINEKCIEKVHKIMNTYLQDILLEDKECDYYDKDSKEIYFPLIENDSFKMIFQLQLSSFACEYNYKETRLGQKLKIGYKDVKDSYCKSTIHMYVKDNSFIEFTKHINNNTWREISLNYSGVSWVVELQNLLVINKDEILNNLINEQYSNQEIK